MNKKSLFVMLFAMLCLAVFTVSVSADQDGLERYCNSDEYGCWVTGDGGSQDYIMFWSEYARDLFMGPGSNAVVTDPVPGGKMSLGKATNQSGKSSSKSAAPVTARSSENMTVDQMKNWLVERLGKDESFNKWLETATEEEIIYNYEHLK